MAGVVRPVAGTVVVMLAVMTVVVAVMRRGLMAMVVPVPVLDD